MGAQGGAWSILPQLALLSTTRPCRILKGRMQSRMGFPQQLGKIWKTNRQKVSLIETYHHIESKTSCQLTDFRLQFMPVLNDKLSYILLQAEIAQKNSEDWEHLVDETVEILKFYHVNFADLEFMRETDNPTRPHEMRFGDIDKKILKSFKKKCNEALENNIATEEFKPKAKKVKGKKKSKKKKETKKKETKKKETKVEKKKSGRKQMTLGFAKKKKKPKRKL